MNGLFPDDQTNGQKDDRDQAGYLLSRSERRIDPHPHKDGGSSPAVDLIRGKIDALYNQIEPNARTEAQEAKTTAPTARSKHQDFMYSLSTSGKSLAEIQSAWHQYYVGLPDHEKREVWQEFYAANAHTPSPHTRIIQSRSAVTRPHVSHAQAHPKAAEPEQPAGLQLAQAEVHMPLHLKPTPSSLQTHSAVVVSEHDRDPIPHRPSEKRSVATIRKQLLRQVRASNSAQLKAKQHLQSLAFGIGLAALFLIIFLFSFFNEIVIAPFIQPRHAEATPIILSQGSAAPSEKPEVIIPKINAQLPTVYGSGTTENEIQKALEDGVAHYASTVFPGQQGNAAYFGHSSNNIFNRGKYKFAFVLLHELVPGDLFYLTHDGKVYTYRVFQKKVVEPTDTWVLNPVEGKAATATLITCDPPGTSLRRLVVWGEQIDPSPSGNTTPAPTQPAPQPEELSSEGPTLWTRFWRNVTPW
jgi:LPXTG-site transpeptidase (sortase) family protein